MLAVTPRAQRGIIGLMCDNATAKNNNNNIWKKPTWSNVVKRQVATHFLSGVGRDGRIQDVGYSSTQLLPYRRGETTKTPFCRADLLLCAKKRVVVKSRQENSTQIIDRPTESYKYNRCGRSELRVRCVR